MGNRKNYKIWALSLKVVFTTEIGTEIDITPHPKPQTGISLSLVVKILNTQCRGHRFDCLSKGTNILHSARHSQRINK